MKRDERLWRALAAMRIEPEGAALGFVARLARENGWTLGRGAAVLEEYRRFLYLAASGPATPSEDVDQAWHLHLTYSRHYWDVLCGTILSRPLHHAPTQGGAVEDARYRALYEATLARYRAAFGEPPPADIWPDTATRFAARLRHVDTARYWLVPKALAGRSAALAGASLLVAACAALAGNVAADGAGAPYVPILAGSLVAVVILFIAVATRKTGRRRDKGCSSADLGCGSDGGSSEGDGGGSGCSSGCSGGCGGGGD